MTFSISRIPSDLPPEDYPGGYHFCRLHLDHEFIEIRQRDPSNSKEAKCLEHLDFPAPVQALFKSCWEFFCPPLVLAGRDIAFHYHRKSLVRESLNLKTLQQAFERAVRFYLEENKRSSFPFVRVLDSNGDVELPDDWWVWVIGYFPEESKALVINIEKFHDLLPVASIDIDEDSLRARFPATVNYFLPPRLRPTDFVPPSLR